MAVPALLDDRDFYIESHSGDLVFRPHAAPVWLAQPNPFRNSEDGEPGHNILDGDYGRLSSVSMADGMWRSGHPRCSLVVLFTLSPSGRELIRALDSRLRAIMFAVASTAPNRTNVRLAEAHVDRHPALAVLLEGTFGEGLRLPLLVRFQSDVAQQPPLFHATSDAVTEVPTAKSILTRLLMS
jgi:hypothetical protein